MFQLHHLLALLGQGYAVALIAFVLVIVVSVWLIARLSR